MVFNDTLCAHHAEHDGYNSRAQHAEHDGIVAITLRVMSASSRRPSMQHFAEWYFRTHFALIMRSMMATIHAEHDGIVAITLRVMSASRRRLSMQHSAESYFRTHYALIMRSMMATLAITLYQTSVAVPATGDMSDDLIVLANDKVRLAFDNQTGQLISLQNLVTSDEYLKNQPDGGNPFRAYVDTTQIPPTLKLGFPWPVQPPEDSLGGMLVDPAACRLVKHDSKHEVGVRTLHLVCSHHLTDLLFDLRVRLRDEDVVVTFDLMIRNQGQQPRRVMAAVTYLTGLGLGAEPAKNLGVHLMGFGQSRGAAWELTGDVYGRIWGGQWDAVYDPDSKSALGVVVKDEKLQNKILRRFPGGGMSVFYFDNHELGPGQSVSFPTTELFVYRGDWMHTARQYGKWFQATFKIRSQPRWVDNVDMFVGAWIPHPDSVAKTKEAPNDPGSFTSFTQLPRLYLNDQRDLKEWAQYWQAVIRHDRYDSYQHTDGVYDFRTDLGGPEEFHRGVLKTEQIGRYVGLYLTSQTMRNDSIFFQKPYPGAGTRAEDWALMETPDAKLPEPVAPGHQSFYMCLRNEPWQDHLASTIASRMRETGARYVRIDEFSSTYLVCHNPAHLHRSPWNATPEILQFLQKLRAAMDEVDPDSLLFTESAVDITSLYCNGTLAMWSSGTDIAPLRLVVPQFAGFSYGIGQVECALQGFITGNLDACNRAGWWNPHHSKIWGPGLERRPKSYPPEGEGLGPPLHWHELGHSFVAAVRHGDPHDTNPVGLGQDHHEWAGRLWCADQYWVMVCGNRAAVRPEVPVRVQLPPLPSEVTAAYEIEMENMAIREAPVTQSGQKAFVSVAGGFSAVLLPTPACPPLVRIEEIGPLEAGGQIVIELTDYAPWRDATHRSRVAISIPGLSVEPSTATLPASVTVSASPQSDPGFYKLLVTGECLPLKRWFQLSPSPKGTTQE